MPHTARVKGSLARYLMSHPHPGLRRRLGVLRQTPYPPGSRSIDADPEHFPLSEKFTDLRVFIYGTNQNAIIYTYDSADLTLTAELAVVDGRIVPETELD